jgi:hypothetical protein
MENYTVSAKPEIKKEMRSRRVEEMRLGVEK